MTAYVPGLEEKDLRKFALSLQQLAAGRSNAVGTVTLTTGAATTVVTPPQSGVVALGSKPLLTATTAAAAAEVASGNLFVSAVANGSFTISHTNSATTGRTFFWAVLG